jgi:hypothetical protein
MIYGRKAERNYSALYVTTICKCEFYYIGFQRDSFFVGIGKVRIFSSCVKAQTTPYMISTVADFLEEFKKYAIEKIQADEKDVVHRPTIGNIFEGLTSSILDKAIFKDLNLKIVQKSFIYNDSNLVSPEMDCLLVVGDGINISFTDQYKYHVKDVIAVIQVKKNLYATDIDDSYKNLKAVIDISEPRDGEVYMTRLQRDAYKLLMSKELPKRETLSTLSDRENIIYHFLLMEAFYPLRIAIGYYGYKDEFSLREGFVNKLEEKVKDGPTKGYSLGSFPNMFIGGDCSIIKTNGMPFGSPFFKKDFYWPILLTSNEKAIYNLLELIWTRLSYKFGIGSSIFGDDFQLDSFHPLLFCKESKTGEDSWGWEYYYNEIPRELLEKPLVPKQWKPLIVTRNQFILLNLLMKIEEIDMSHDDKFKQLVKQENIDLAKTIKELEEERFIYIEDNKIKFLTDELKMVALNGKIYAGENKSRELDTFISKLK